MSRSHACLDRLLSFDLDLDRPRLLGGGDLEVLCLFGGGDLEGLRLFGGGELEVPFLSAGGVIDRAVYLKQNFTNQNV